MAIATVTDLSDPILPPLFTEYPNGSCCHDQFELACKTKDNYVPDERMLDPSLMKSVFKSSAASVMDMEAETVAGGGAHVLSNGDCCLLHCRASSQVEEDLEWQFRCPQNYPRRRGVHGHSSAQC